MDDDLVFFNVKQAQEILQCGENMVRYLIKSGQLRGKQVGKKMLTSKAAIREFMDTPNRETPKITVNVRKVKPPVAGVDLRRKRASV